MKVQPLFYYALRLFRRSVVGKHNRREIIGAISAIAFSLVPLIMALQVTNGMVQGISNRYIDIASFHIQGRIYDNDPEDSQELLYTAMENIAGAERHFPFIEAPAIIYNENVRQGAFVRALPQNIADIHPAFFNYIEITDGRFTLADPDSIILSRELAANLSVSVGDTINLLSGRNDPRRGMLLRPNKFVVGAVYSSGYAQLDGSTALINYAKGKQLYPDKTQQKIAVIVDDPYNEPLLENLKFRLNSLDSRFVFFSWQQLNQQMRQNFESTRSIILFIIFLIVAVAAVNISSTMKMLILERESDIAIMKVCGVPALAISISFLISGLVIGTTALIIGLALGLLAAVNINQILFIINNLAAGAGSLAAYLSGGDRLDDENFQILNNLYYLEEIPIVIPFNEIFFTALFTLVLVAFACAIPSWKAGNVKPLSVISKH